MRSIWLDQVPYQTALALQEQLVYQKIKNREHGFPKPEDTLLLLKHPPVFTYQDPEDFKTCLKNQSEHAFKQWARGRGAEVVQTNRDGMLTYHGPGQLVGYVIMELDRDLHEFIGTLARGITTTLSTYGVASVHRHGAHAGIWVGERKICSRGMRVKHGVTFHGFALNVTDEPLSYFDHIHPCGITEEKVMTTLSAHADVPMEQVVEDVARNMGVVFGSTMHMVEPQELGFFLKHKPDWIRIRPPKLGAMAKAHQLVKEAQLHTVCEEAHCPNIGECWSRGDITVMILGDTCTRSCPFCNVKTIQKGQRLPLDLNEPHRVAQAVSQIPHSHIVLTSVDRDELSDGGAELWAHTIKMVKQRSPDKTVEALTPDFGVTKDNPERVRTECLDLVLQAQPDVFAHNIETVKRLHRKVRPQGNYNRSLNVLRFVKQHETRPIVKTNIMLGHGESEGEVIETVRELKKIGIDVLTITQYLQPSKEHLPVIKYYSPKEFQALQKKAEEIGIPVVIAGPLVRTSYKAGEAYGAIVKKRAENPARAA